MSTDSEVLDIVEKAFANVPRPDRFTDNTHCDECAEHDELLRQRTRATLNLQDVGNPGWDPICFVSPEGFAYYLPALARLALAAPDEDGGWCGDQFFFHLRYDGSANARVRACDARQRAAVVALLRHIRASRPRLVEEHLAGPALDDAIAAWTLPT